MNNLDNRNGGPPAKKFNLDKHDAKLMGVCGGIARYVGVDVMLVRLGFVLGTIFLAGSLALVYVAIGLIAD